MHLELRLEGETVVNVDVKLREFVNLLEEFKWVIEQGKPWDSAPISVDDARELISSLDEKSVEFLRQVVSGGGVITWPKVQEIFGIQGTDFDEFDLRCNAGIKTALRRITQGRHSEIISWDEQAPEWDTVDWKDLRFEIDGRALQSLTQVLGK